MPATTEHNAKNEMILAYLSERRDKARSFKAVRVKLSGDWHATEERRSLIEQFLRMFVSVIDDAVLSETSAGDFLLIGPSLRPKTAKALAVELGRWLLSKTLFSARQIVFMDFAVSLDDFLKYLSEDSKAAQGVQSAVDSRPAAAMSEIESLDGVLARADVSPFLFSQGAFPPAAPPAGLPLLSPPKVLAGRRSSPSQPASAFQEIYVSLAGLEKAFLPERSIPGNRWGLRHLAERLDERVLAHLVSVPPSSKTSVNMSLATLLSPRFASFLKLAPQRTKSNLMVEVHRTDALDRMQDYKAAQRLLARHQIPLLVDGFDPESLSMIDADAFQAAAVKLIWSDSLVDLSEESRRLATRLAGLKTPVVLVRCDHAAGLEFARLHGVALVQGRIVEALLKEDLLAASDASAT